MEKEIKEKKEVEDCKHEFYCDICGTYLGASYEYEDGYYEEKGKRVDNQFLFDTWYELDKIFCEKCYLKFKKKVLSIAKELGFKKEVY
ncbi:MAG: hypothetical protein IKM97_04910 [Clostridia bacterium]|nr:hypothetical protein [Clostridia bacterium]